jgi:hypothetical protein
VRGQPLSIVSHHVHELKRCRAFQFVEEGERCGPATYLYQAAWWVRLKPRVVSLAARSGHVVLGEDRVNSQMHKAPFDD